MEHKTKAWIVSGILFLALLTWTLVAVHDSAVAAARAARANKTDAAQGGCPFSMEAQEAKKKPCCHSDAKDSGKESAVKSAKSLASKGFEKFADLDDEQLEEVMKQFTPEQLAKCPHLNKKKNLKK